MNTAAVSAAAWHPMHDGGSFAEFPGAVEVLIEPTASGAWTWSVGKHFVFGFKHLFSGTTLTEEEAKAQALSAAALVE